MKVYIAFRYRIDDIYNLSRRPNERGLPAYIAWPTREAAWAHADKFRAEHPENSYCVHEYEVQP